MKRVICMLMFFLILTPFSEGAEEIIKKGESLSLDRCIEIALKQQPGVLAAKGSVDLYFARKGQAESGYWPQIDATAGYSRIQPSAGSSSLSSGSSHSFEQYSTGITAKQTIFDFGKTGSNVSIQKNYIDASKADLANTEDQIILNVKQSYYNILRTARNRVVAAETVHQFQKHLEQAKAFYEVGTKPKFDVTKAEVDLSNAKLNLIRADNSLKIATVVLNNAMGVPEAPGYLIEDNLSFQKYEIKPEEAIEKAYSNRPELRSVISKKKAAEESILLAKKGYFPVLIGNANWSWAGAAGGFAAGDGWNAGVALSIPIFSGFLTKNQVSEARANLSILAANEESLRQTVLLDVQQSILNLKEAEERIATAELTVRQAGENYDIAIGRYNAGVGNPIEVTDAEVVLSNAKTAHIQALYDYRVARASLEKAMGVR